MISNELTEFLQLHKRNAWIEVGPYEIYVRHGIHRVNGEIINCFDVATINNQVESSKGRGGFVILMEIIKELLSMPEYKHDTQAIYVESVLNSGLCKLLPKIGYVEQSTIPPSFAKLLPEPMELVDMNEMDAKHPGWDSYPTLEDKLAYLERMKEG